MDGVTASGATTGAPGLPLGYKALTPLYSEQHVTFEEDAGAYDQKDAAGFIKINALRLRLLAMRDKRLKG